MSEAWHESGLDSPVELDAMQGWTAQKRDAPRGRGRVPDDPGCPPIRTSHALALQEDEGLNSPCNI